jgi:hypothetical protein
MKPSTLLVAVSLGILVGLSMARADESHAPHGVPSEKLGSVQFPVSCQKASQQPFNRAVALLHSFWYDEAEKAFRALADADPDCVMAHWGVAMSVYHPLWAPPSAADLAKGRAAVETARGLKAQTARERDYLDAIATFYQHSETADHRTRSLAYAKAMEQVAAKHSGDKEAAIFYALALDGTALPSDKSYANQKKAGEILKPIFKDNHEHPGVAHYLIHSYDYPPLAEQGLEAARRYAKVAPSSPHALHMPSHIFTRLGLWEESIGSNLDSARAAKAGSAEALHALDYLMYAYLQRGQDGKAKALDAEVRRMIHVDPESFAAAYAVAAIPARYALERRDNALAATLVPSPAVPWARFRQYEAITHFARAIGLARTGHPSEAKKAVAQLVAIRQALADAKDTYWADQVEIQRRAAAAEVAWAERYNGQEALTLMRSAAELEAATEKHPVTPGAVLPARELLAEFLIEMSHAEMSLALKEYEASLAVSPNRFNAVYGAARAARLAGYTATAATYYRALVSLAAGGDGTRAELKEARTFLENVGAGSH